MLKVFNDTTKTLSDIYYFTTNLYIIKSISIDGAFEECIIKEFELVQFIEVTTSKLYGPSLNIDFEENETFLAQAPTN